jgi:phosphatidylserine/phosphatidylglycerophosphate/cardiolipin synthase-like enzyme
MRKFFCALAFCTLLGAAIAAPALPPGVRVLFGPRDNLEDALVRMIDASKTELLFSQNAITLPRVAAAIVRAFQVRKVFVAGIIDRDPGIANYTTPGYFRLNGIPVVFSSRPNNNKYLVIDQTIVVTGSADWTKASMKENSENLLVIQEPSIAAQYRAAFSADYTKGTSITSKQ